MANMIPSKRPAPRRQITLQEPAPEFTKYLPYAAVAAVVLGLVVVISRGNDYSVHAAAVLATSGILGVGYGAWTHSHALPPGDALRTWVGAATILVIVGALVPLLMALYPPAPKGRVSLAHQGDSAVIHLHGAANTVVLIASGDFKPDVGNQVQARYKIIAAHHGVEEDCDGVFARTTTETAIGRRARGASGVSESRANRHVLRTLAGPGEYTLTLYRMAETLLPPLRVDVIVEPFSQWMLAVLFGALSVLAIGVDVALYRRGGEPALAALLLFPLAGVFYFHGHMTRATLPTDLIAAAVVGVLAGGLGGELIARGGRMLAGQGR